MPGSGKLTVPGNGAIASAVTLSSGREVDVTVGKPDPEGLLDAIEEMGLTPKDVVVVGDRYDKDVMVGVNAGCSTILLCNSGVTTPAEVEKKLKEGTAHFTYYCDDVAQLNSLMQF